MAGTDRIVYSVSTRAGGDWQVQGEVADMHSALTAAEKLFASRQFAEVKVDKRFFDGAHGREVTATILQRALEGKSARPFAVLFWLGLAALGGVISFAVTYVLTSGSLS